MNHIPSTDYDKTADEHICSSGGIHPDKEKRIRETLAQEQRFNLAAELFKVMGDYGRSRILYCLMEGEFCVCELAALVEMSHSAVSHQLRILRANRLVRHHRRGKQVYYALDDDHVRTLMYQAMSHVDETEGTGYENKT